MTRKAGQHRKDRHQEEYVLYIVEVAKWDHYYGYSAHTKSRYEDAGYRHTETLTFTGRPIIPEGFKYQNVEVTLSAHKEFTADASEGFRAVIGALDAAGDTLRAHVFIPSNHMPQLVAVTASGRVRVVSLTGTPLKRRSGTISNVSVTTSADELSNDDEI